MLLFLSKLNSLTGEYVNPIIEGVQHKKIVEEKNKGYAISYIPPSDSGPHMAKAGENRYFKRSGDSFYPMEHFDIEDMFGRRKKPDLKLKCFIKEGCVRNGYTWPFKIVIAIENIGRGTAKSPFLELIVKPPYQIDKHGVDGNGNFGLPKFGASTTNHARFGASGTLVLHPGVRHEVAIIEAIIRDDAPGMPDVSFEYKISAEDVSMNEGLQSITVAELFASR